LPPIVERFVEKLKFGKENYIFAVVTAGLSKGISIFNLSKLLMNKGDKLNAAFLVRMPGNNITLYNAWPKIIQDFMLKNAKIKSIKIAQKIKDKISNQKIHLKAKHGSNSIYSLTKIFKNYHDFAKNYIVTDKCNGCKLCFKICPVSNITISNGKPIFDNKCERCMACIQWCPQQAIEYKSITRKRKRYRNPQITASDLFFGK